MTHFDSRIDTCQHRDTVRKFLNYVVEELLWRAQDHDVSKLVSPEREVYDEFVPKLQHVEFGSDEYKALTTQMGEGLKHHYAHNEHHPQHWECGIRDMSLIDLIEMICDWMAAAERKDIRGVKNSIDTGQERFGYSDDLKHIFHNTVRSLCPRVYREGKGD